MYLGIMVKLGTVYLTVVDSEIHNSLSLCSKPSRRCFIIPICAESPHCKLCTLQNATETVFQCSKRAKVPCEQILFSASQVFDHTHSTFSLQLAKNMHALVDDYLKLTLDDSTSRPEMYCFNAFRLVAFKLVAFKLFLFYFLLSFCAQ
jgi:hypothetical protein